MNRRYKHVYALMASPKIEIDVYYFDAYPQPYIHDQVQVDVVTLQTFFPRRVFQFMKRVNV